MQHTASIPYYEANAPVIVAPPTGEEPAPHSARIAEMNRRLQELLKRFAEHRQRPGGPRI